MNGDFWMIEVLPVLSVENGTAVTMVKLDQLHKKRRRRKRDNYYNRELPFSKAFVAKPIKIALAFSKVPYASGYMTINHKLSISSILTVSIVVSSKRNQNGKMIPEDASVGVKMDGTVTYDVGVDFIVKAR